jgi:MFS family permease
MHVHPGNRLLADTQNTFSAAFQPLYGQLANLWGRRWLMISSVAIFTLGSGMCGSASTANMLIGSRVVQGFGAGGINVLVDLIICDLVPLRDRGIFIGLVMAIMAIATSLGPLVGGVLARHDTWRLAFYLHLPIGGFTMVLLIIYLRVEHKRELESMERIKRIDWIGNAMLIASTFSILFALAYGGTRYPWSSSSIILSLVLGFVGLVLFYLHEASSTSLNPVMPPRLFANRTSLAAFFLSFQHSLLSMWVTYLMPLYFQSVLGSSPTRSGIQVLPLALVFLPCAAIAGGVLQKTGRYRPVHFIGFALATLGLSLNGLLDSYSRVGIWVIFQMIIAAGLGMLISCLLPAVQANLDESDAASSAAAWAYIRSLGTVWGFSIPAVVFNNRFNQLLPRISNPAVRDLLIDGQAYGHASGEFIKSFGLVTRSQIVSVYSDSLKWVWHIAVVFAGVSFLMVFVEKETKLRTELETDFRLKEKSMKDKDGSLW